MRRTQKRALKKRRIPATWCMVAAMFFGLHLFARCQTATVVIAEVMYDHPLYDNETVKIGQEGEFMSLYNYEEEEVDISGWRIEITDQTASFRNIYRYTLPANTVLPESGTVVIASRAANSDFDVLQFYGMETPEDAEGYLLLYTSSLAFPDTRTRIRVYDAQGNLQDELVYNGNSDALTGEKLLRAENAVNPQRPLSETVSLQREKIIITEGRRNISRTDFFAPDPELTVQLFTYSPDYYDYEDSSLIIDEQFNTTNLTLSGTVKEGKDYKASTIVSSQVIESGKVSFLAEEDIVLNHGFEIKDGAEFEATVERDSFHHVTILTYNLWGTHTNYKKHAQVIKASKAAIVAVQEVKLSINFLILKNSCGLKGKKCFPLVEYGIGMLWNPDVVGDPIRQTYEKIKTPDDKYDRKRAYMVAEFNDFCFVSTHYSVDSNHRKAMTSKILGNKLVKRCLNSDKPIYVAGDMNARPTESPIQLFTDTGFVVLNDRAMIDLILEYNKNPHHKIMERGRHFAPFTEDTWEDQQISDHKPYRVKVKIK